MIKLERSCPAAAHWSECQYQDALNQSGSRPERLVLVAEMDPSIASEAGVKNPAQKDLRRGTLVGFLVARQVSREWELENIVVAAEERRKGIGAALLRALLDHARQGGGKELFLEVRESNGAARRLYEKAGFRETGRRKMYYSDPPEDAILYSQDVV